MKIKLREMDASWLTQSLKSLGFSATTQIDAKSTNIYEVHAIAVWSDVVLYQFVGESGVIAWVPSNAFDIVEHSIPIDWLVNRLDDEVPLVIGPNFIAADKKSYSDMVELIPGKLAQFNQRLQQ